MADNWYTGNANVGWVHHPGEGRRLRRLGSGDRPLLAGREGLHRYHSVLAIDPLGLPWDEMPDLPGVPRDRDARPSLDAVLELRRDRMATVRRVIEGLTDESLDRHTEPVEAPGWPEPRSYPVRECLLVILNEEWEHRLYAERDLDALKAHTA